MTNFDPFFSSDYQKMVKEEKNQEPELSLTRKTDSQYLQELLSSCFSGSSKEITEHSETEMVMEKQSQEQKSEQNISKNSSSSGSSKRSSKNSPFHNFQKHLVITLRQILTLKVLNEKVGQEYELAAKIFEYFKKSNKTSRLFLEQIFGLFQVRDPSSKMEFIENLRKGELQELLYGFRDETVMGAQEVLKKYTKIELDECDVNQALARRKIEKKKEFIEYINLFKVELLEGKQRKKTYKQLAKRFQNL